MTETSIIGNYDAAVLAKDKEHSCLKLITRKMHNAIPPFYLDNIPKAVAIMLNNEIEFYCPEVKGVPVAFNRKKVKMLSQHGVIIPGQEKTHTDFEVEFVVFSPTVGDTLKGIVHKLNPKTFGCLVHGYFYVSVKYHQGLYNEKVFVDLGDEVDLKVTKLDEDGQGYLSIFGECLSKTGNKVHVEIDSGIDDIDRDAHMMDTSSSKRFGHSHISQEENVNDSNARDLASSHLADDESLINGEKESDVQSNSTNLIPQNEEFVCPDTTNDVTVNDTTADDSSFIKPISTPSKEKKKKKKGADEKDKMLAKLQKKLAKMEEKARLKKERKKMKKLEKSGIDTSSLGESLLIKSEVESNASSNEQNMSFLSTRTDPNTSIQTTLMSDDSLLPQSQLSTTLPFPHIDEAARKEKKKEKKSHKKSKKHKKDKKSSEKKAKKRKRDPTEVTSDQTTEDESAAVPAKRVKM